MTRRLPGLASLRTFEEELFPVCSPGLLAGAEPLRQPGDLRRHTLIHLDWQAQGETWPDWRMWLLAAGHEAKAGAHWAAALEITLRLVGEGRLAPADRYFVEELERRLAANGVR